MSAIVVFAHLALHHCLAFRVGFLERRIPTVVTDPGEHHLRLEPAFHDCCYWLSAQVTAPISIVVGHCLVLLNCRRPAGAVTDVPYRPPLEGANVYAR